MTLEVYLDPCTVNSRKVLAGLDLLGTQFHLNHVNYITSEHKGEKYLKINPHATVPSAVDDGNPITQSNAILMYAADRDGDNPAYPKDLKQRAEVNQWLLWEASAWFPSCYICLVEYVVKPLLKSEPNQSIIDAEAPNWHKLATILDNRFAKTKWLCGDQLTIADIAVAAPMHLHTAQHLPLDQYPNLKRWMTEDIEKLPCWQKTQGNVEKVLLPKGGSTNGTENVPSSVRARLNYTKNISPKLTELYFYESEAAKGIHEPGDDPHEVDFYDGWYRAKEFSIDTQGFSLHDFKTEFEKWEDEETTRTNFYPEVVNFLKKTIGAKKVTFVRPQRKTPRGGKSDRYFDLGVIGNIDAYQNSYRSA